MRGSYEVNAQETWFSWSFLHMAVKHMVIALEILCLPCMCLAHTKVTFGAAFQTHVTHGPIDPNCTVWLCPAVRVEDHALMPICVAKASLRRPELPRARENNENNTGSTWQWMDDTLMYF